MKIGNVTKDTEITFEFGLREGNNIIRFLFIIKFNWNVYFLLDAELPPATTELPFQLKITYNALDGMAFHLFI